MFLKNNKEIKNKTMLYFDNIGLFTKKRFFSTYREKVILNELCDLEMLLGD